MSILLNVARRAIRARPLHLRDTARIGMARVARDIHVPARQRKSKTVVIEIASIRVHAIVAGQAVPTPAEDVRSGERQIHLTVTVCTDDLVEAGDIGDVTIAARERLVPDLEPVTV